MAPVRRALSIVLLASGVILVFAGVNVAVGFSVAGVLSSAAAVAALLYSGAVWFGPRPAGGPPTPETVFVYDRLLNLVSGSRRGASLTSCFPVSVRADLENRCLAALAGTGARFSCGSGSARFDFDAVPVRSADGMIVYGLLIASAESAQPAINPAAV